MSIPDASASSGVAGGGIPQTSYTSTPVATESDLAFDGYWDISTNGLTRGSLQESWDRVFGPTIHPIKKTAQKPISAGLQSPLLPNNFVLTKKTITIGN